MEPVKSQENWKRGATMRKFEDTKRIISNRKSKDKTIHDKRTSTNTPMIFLYIILRLAFLPVSKACTNKLYILQQRTCIVYIRQGFNNHMIVSMEFILFDELICMEKLKFKTIVNNYKKHFCLLLKVSDRETLFCSIIDDIIKYFVCKRFL